MKQIIIAMVALLLLAANLPAQNLGLIPDELYDYGFVLKRVEITAVLEKEDPPVKNLVTPQSAPTPPKSLWTSVNLKEAAQTDSEIAAWQDKTRKQLGIPVATDLPALPPPLPPLQLDVKIPKVDAPKGLPATPMPQPYNPNPRPFPGPPVDDSIAPPLPRGELIAGNKWMTLKSGKQIQVGTEFTWKEFPNGDVRGCKPGNKILFSKKQQEYYEADPAFRYWDTDAGVQMTQRGEKLVQGPLTGDYYAIPREDVMNESPVTVATPGVSLVYRSALLPRNRVRAVPTTTYSSGIRTSHYPASRSPAAGPPIMYSPMPAASCRGGRCCPGGNCNW